MIQAHRRTTAPQRPPRYRIQFRNGVWHLFDTIWYTAIAAFTCEKEALLALHTSPSRRAP